MGRSIFSLTEISFMAPEGQTLPHKVQVYSQYPCVMMRWGVQNPAIPASARVGLITFVGQTFMQSPHRWQSSRKSPSGKEPGGLINRGSGTLCTCPSSLPNKGREIPATSPPSTARLPISVLLFNWRDHLNLKERASSGQASEQLKQATHSAFSQSCPGKGEAAPWQCFVQSLQSVHFSSSFSSLRMLTLEHRPSKAPRGHRMRHQKRGLIRLRNRMMRKVSPMNQAVLKAG
jgi:hypothetical protein